MTAGPLYQVISRDIADQIASGSLHGGDRIDSELRLAEHYGVSRMTVRQALGELESEGLVVRRHGSGTFVSSPRPIERRTNQLGAFHEEMGLDSRAIETRLLLQEVAQPPATVAADLALSPGQTVSHLLRLRLLDGRPIAVQESWLPYVLAPGVARDGLVGGSLYRTLLERAGVEMKWAEQSVAASTATAELAGLLDVPDGSPVLSIRRRSYSTGPTPVEIAQSHTVPTLPLVMRLER